MFPLVFVDEELGEHIRRHGPCVTILQFIPTGTKLLRNKTQLYSMSSVNMTELLKFSRTYDLCRRLIILVYNGQYLLL